MRERWEGVCLPGDYLLQEWLSGDDAAGFFETSLADGRRRAIVKLVPEWSSDGAAQLALWRRTRSLRHPNLRELLDCGRAELAGKSAVYAVFEYAEDTLASALGKSPLSEAEAREVLDAAVAALGYLQGQGLAQPSLDPDHVVAVGERIKLSTDGLREAAAGAPYTNALRAFWHQISPSSPARSADILTRALGAEPGGYPDTGQLAVDSERTPAPADIAPAADVPVRPLVAEAALPPRPFPKWIPVGAAGVVLLILGLRFLGAPKAPASPHPARASPPASAPMVASPAVPKASPGAATISKPESKPESKPAVKPAPKPAPKPADASQGTWRVIAYTYRSHDAAARKADSINQRHAGLAATVFSPQDKQGYFLVALGGRMSRQNAVRLQGKARVDGLARDVYVKNFLN